LACFNAGAWSGPPVPPVVVQSAGHTPPECCPTTSAAEPPPRALVGGHTRCSRLDVKGLPRRKAFDPVECLSRRTAAEVIHGHHGPMEAEVAVVWRACRASLELEQPRRPVSAAAEVKTNGASREHLLRRLKPRRTGRPLRRVQATLPDETIMSAPRVMLGAGICDPFGLSLGTQPGDSAGRDTPSCEIEQVAPTARYASTDHCKSPYSSCIERISHSTLCGVRTLSAADAPENPPAAAVPAGGARGGLGDLGGARR